MSLLLSLNANSVMGHCTGCALGVSEITELDQAGVQQSACVRNREWSRGQRRNQRHSESVLLHCKSLCCYNVSLNNAKP
jgi:hypothetical protein